MAEYDLAVVGAGSGGIGAAITAARAGLSVLLIERHRQLGGTAGPGGIHDWAPVAGATGLSLEIYKRLKRLPNAVGVNSYARHVSGGDDFPGGELLVDPQLGYIDTLQRHNPAGGDMLGFFRRRCHGISFEADAYERVIEEMLAETNRCTILRGVTFGKVDMKAGTIAALRLDDGRRASADAYVDATGDGALCVACGCEAMVGQESRSSFQEPDAPDQATNAINSVSLIYRISRVSPGRVEPLPPKVPAQCWWADGFPYAHITQYPCGDFNVNMLPTMSGSEALRLGPQAAYAECIRRLAAHWHWIQTAFGEFQCYRRSWTAPCLAWRETRRIRGRYVLTEHDLLDGLAGQAHDDIIAIADHGIDRHVAGGGYVNLRQPYGIPLRCLMPAGVENLLIACRAASFSSLAASSCRLTRTMMQLGQAAGTAVAVAKACGVPLQEAPAERVRQCLRDQRVQLDWPMPTELAKYIPGQEAV